MFGRPFDLGSKLHAGNMAGNGAAKIPALCVRTAKSGQFLADFRSFDALRRDRDVKRPAQGSDGFDDGRTLLVVTERVDEAAVDLDPVERERLKLAQRRIARAEIVERDRDPAVPETLDDRQRLLTVLHERGFGDFDFKPAGRKAGLRQKLDDALREPRIAKLDR